uniref:Cation transport regulator-like protein 2 n=1 Tax=Phallusia mammillata TaxID=59560 RepID=A0A6F9D8M5_9ASCI|nr:cation transport regulator-like protein 2 [Phallusia mammillata]
MVSSRGKSGHNLEYLFNLVDALRNEAPHGVDSHLSSLEDACHQHLSGILLRRHVALGCGQRWDDCCKCLGQKARDDDQYVLKCISSRLCFIKKCIKDNLSR